jgi:hypothetical protein
MRRWLGVVLALFPQVLWGWTLAGPNLGGWPGYTIVVYYNFSACPLSESVLLPMLQTAVDVWNTVPTSGLTLTVASGPSSATAADFLNSAATQTPLVVCDPNFGPDNGVDPDYVPGATRLAVAPDGHLDYAGIMLNGQTGTGAEISSLSSGELQVAITHELGHAQGLGHSSDSRALMYYSIGSKTTPILTEDDVDGVSFLYPRNELKANPFGCAAVHGAAAPGSLAWIGVFLAVNLGIGRWLQRRARRA